MNGNHKNGKVATTLRIDTLDYDRLTTLAVRKRGRSLNSYITYILKQHLSREWTDVTYLCTILWSEDGAVAHLQCQAGTGANVKTVAFFEVPHEDRSKDILRKLIDAKIKPLSQGAIIHVKELPGRGRKESEVRHIHPSRGPREASEQVVNRGDTTVQ